MASPLNIGVRHVLPVFPFVFALAGGGAGWLLQQRRAWAYVVGLLLLGHVVSSLRTFPNYLPYANELWGGPAKTHLYFTDSAADWAQQLKWTKQWTDAHDVKQCWFAYFAAPFLLPKDYGIPCELLPTADTSGEIDTPVPAVIHGPVLISFGTLNGFEYGTKVRNPYQKLFERKPDEVIANAIAVFYGDFSLPEAEAQEFEDQTYADLAKDPQGALRAAKAGVALAPEGFDANRALAAAYAAVGDKSSALAAYGVAMRRTADMEPSSRDQWRGMLEAEMAKLAATPSR